MSALQDAFKKWDRWGSMLGLKPSEQIWTEEEAEALVEAAKRVANLNWEAAIATYTRMERPAIFNYEKFVHNIVFAALSITENESV